jgi:dihydropyrimidinase
LFSEGVVGGRVELERFVALNSTNAARIYGLYPRKGTIAVGSDADIAIWDPDTKVVIRNAALHHNVDYTPYEGRTVTGWPTTVLSRGDIICSDGTLHADAGRGRFLECGSPEPVVASSRTPKERPWI